MKSIVLAVFIVFASNAFSFDRDQCTVGLVRYLTFYNNTGFIPLTVGKIAKSALSNCKVPFGNRFTDESTECAMKDLADLGQLGGNHSLCSEIGSDLEQDCFNYIYDLYPDKRFRPVSYLKMCVGITSQRQLDCIKKQSTGWKLYFFDEDNMRDCNRDCSPN